MCLGIPGQVVDIVDAEQSLAKVDVNGVRRNISVRLLADDNLKVVFGGKKTVNMFEMTKLVGKHLK